MLRFQTNVAHGPEDTDGSISAEFYHQLSDFKKCVTDFVVLTRDLNVKVGSLGMESRLDGQWELVGGRSDNGDHPM